MMKTHGFGMVMAAAVAVLLIGCGGDEGSEISPADSDEAFLQEVRREALTANSSESGAISTNSELAKIEVETDTFEMGVIANNKITHAEMKVYNRGGAPLKIMKVTTSCGCTTGQMLDDIIPPGQYGRLRISVDPARIPGYYAMKTLTLFSNDPGQPTTMVNVVSHVEPEMKFIPEGFKLGDLPQGQGGEVVVRVRQLQEEPMELSSIRVRLDSTHLAAEVNLIPEEEWQVAGKREYDLKVTLAPDAPSKEYSDRIDVTTNIKRSPNMTLRFSATVLGVYSLEPKKISLRNVNVGQSYESVLSLQSEKPLEILEFSNSNENLNVSHRPGDEPGVHLFDVEVVGRSDSRLLKDSWNLRINAGGEEYTETIDVTLVLAAQ